MDVAGAAWRSLAEQHQLDTEDCVSFNQCLCGHRYEPDRGRMNHLTFLHLLDQWVGSLVLDGELPDLRCQPIALRLFLDGDRRYGPRAQDVAEETRRLYRELESDDAVTFTLSQVLTWNGTLDELVATANAVCTV